MIQFDNSTASCGNRKKNKINKNAGSELRGKGAGERRPKTLINKWDGKNHKDDQKLNTRIEVVLFFFRLTSLSGFGEGEK
ncbi:MAG: hypothetical protein ABJ059_00500, partial [Hyphomicrobiales bacterium]